ncbi:MAG: bifunctional 5,10-methylene-tetrahydrofolate dehydrogenase/5,10-methylene-tetrahydrofolate cyclohydrolase [Candidatus Marinimicrobia bacterium]|nr:bifunctional 5,10-methylene-tetrahydrofolate dehydrogenase/5,10-methylene-tetrahydrofolate cyclohydrolase [Candidatus Neomarinimicrobiota bacterium]|tara:strand:- start:32247 stop:33125 length:879 start_codon:yes stop_codon:yes gene_type:complete
MDTLLLKGLPVSQNIKLSLKKEIDSLRNKNVIPTLSAVLVGNDPASQIYVNSKHKTFINNNCKSTVHKLDEHIPENELIDFIYSLNNDSDVHGILVQLPLPKHLNEEKVLEAIDARKDVDGIHPLNVGKLLRGIPDFISCTPAGCLEILKYYNIPVQSRHVVIVGRSNIVGKPLMALLSQKFKIGNSTVTICHTGTKDIKAYTMQADILIAAIGNPNYIDANMVKQGVDILDVGINRIKDDSEKGYKIIGDVDYDSVFGIANSITPVPGGVGPMTITMLLNNTVKAAGRTIS